MMITNDRALLPTLARACLAAAFIVSGTSKLLDFNGAMGEVHTLTGLPFEALLAVAVIVTQLGGSVLLIAGGRAAKLGAVLLGGFTIVATLLAHRYWEMTGAARFASMNSFYEHIGLVGGFALAAFWPKRRADA